MVERNRSGQPAFLSPHTGHRAREGRGSGGVLHHRPMDPLDALPIGVTTLLIAALLFGACETGFRLGGRKNGAEKTDQGHVLSAMLALLGLLVGFTFSIAVGRHELRRSLVVEEANAIGTEYLRTQMVPEPFRARVDPGSGSSAPWHDQGEPAAVDGSAGVNEVTVGSGRWGVGGDCKRALDAFTSHFAPHTAHCAATLLRRIRTLTRSNRPSM